MALLFERQLLSPRMCAVLQRASKGSFKPIEEFEVSIRETMKQAKNRTRCYLWGGTVSGALGSDRFVRPDQPYVRPREYRSSPSKLMFSETHKIRDVACGNGFTIFAAQSDASENKFQLFGTGVNKSSQIGLQQARRNAPMELLTEPVPIDFPNDESGKKLRAEKVAAGRAHSIVVTNTGSVYGFGDNSLGQCGRRIDPDEQYFGRNLLSRIKIPEKVIYAVCGLDHTLFLTAKGEVYSCGWGADGQTGLGHYNNTGVPEKVGGDISGVHIVDISCRADCVLARSESGDLFGWGNNEYGQLLGASNEMQLHTAKHIPLNRKLKAIAAGGSSCVAMDEEGNVFSWGYGILGVGPKVQHATSPQLIEPSLFGMNELNPNSKVVHIVAGLSDFAALTSFGHLYTWGRNHNGCLGIGHIKQQMFPLRVHLTAEVKRISVGVDHMAVITSSFF